MSDAGRLLEAFARGALVRPWQAPTTLDLAHAIAVLTGSADGTSPAARSLADEIGPSPHLIFALVDGLGMNLIDELSRDSFLRRHARAEIAAVFPSSTAPALTSIATRVPPATHGVCTWFVYLEDHDLQTIALPFIERYAKRPLAEFGVTAAEMLPCASQIASLAPATMCVLPQRIARSAYSTWFSAGAATAGYASLRGAVDAIVARVEAARTPTFTYLYIPYVDQAEHEHGVVNARVHRALRRVEARLERLTQRLRGRARLVVTADHGLLTVEPKDQREIAPGSELRALLRADPSGEPRVPIFHVSDGAHDAFERVFRRTFGNTCVLLSAGEVTRLGLLGSCELSAATRARIGDYLAVPLSGETIAYRQESPMLGFHGGLSPDEMRVPLVVA